MTDLPTYFIHPCNTHEALNAVSEGKELAPEEYLGSSVSLHIPSKLVSKK